MDSEKQKISESAFSKSMPSTWYGWLFFFLLFCCTYLAASLMSTWLFGSQFRPLAVVGQIAWMFTIMGLIWRRKLLKEREPKDTHFRWYRFSLAELFVLVTGFAVFAGLLGADASQQRNTRRQREQLQSVVLEVLGPEGQLGFESDGTLTISVCDRSFDDQSLIELERLIRDYVESNGISRILFGTGSRTAGTAPRWSGITDASLDVLLKWQDIKMIAIEGTSITAVGRKQLLRLEELDEWSQASLSGK